MTDFFEDLETIDEDKGDQTKLLGQLGEFAIAMEKKAAEIKTLEEGLAKEQKTFLKLSMDLIPDLMDQLGLKEMTLKSGKKISIKDDMKVSIKKDQNTPFISWMIKKGFQALVKNKVEVQFPKEGRKSSQSFVKYIRRYYKNKCSMIENEIIHPQTLKAWAKGRKEDGKKLPEKFLNVFNYTIAKLK